MSKDIFFLPETMTLEHLNQICEMLDCRPRPALPKKMNPGDTYSYTIRFETGYSKTILVVEPPVWDLGEPIDYLCPSMVSTMQA